MSRPTKWPKSPERLHKACASQFCKAKSLTSPCKHLLRFLLFPFDNPSPLSGQSCPCPRPFLHLQVPDSTGDCLELYVYSRLAANAASVANIVVIMLSFTRLIDISASYKEMTYRATCIVFITSGKPTIVGYVYIYIYLGI